MAIWPTPAFAVFEAGIKKIVVMGVGLVAGRYAGKAATAPDTPDPTVIDPIIGPLAGLSDTAMLILAGVAVLAIVGIWSLIRGRSA